MRMPVPFSKWCIIPVTHDGYGVIEVIHDVHVSAHIADGPSKCDDPGVEIAPPPNDKVPQTPSLPHGNVPHDHVPQTPPLPQPEQYVAIQ